MKGFVQLRRGLLDHMEDGSLDANEFFLFGYLLMRARATGYMAGMATISKTDIGANLGWPMKKTYKTLNSLIAKDYIKYFPQTKKQPRAQFRIYKYKNGEVDMTAHETPVTTPVGTPVVTPVEGTTQSSQQPKGQRNKVIRGEGDKLININTLFDEFYKEYPKHRKPQDAKKAFKKLIDSKQDPQRIISAARNYRKEMRFTEQQYIQHPSTFLNSGDWEEFSKTKIAAVEVAPEPELTKEEKIKSEEVRLRVMAKIKELSMAKGVSV